MWPRCSNGDRDAIDPTLYDECERYFVSTNGEVICKDCMRDFIRDHMDEHLDEIASLMGYAVRYH